jgi:alkanesulfonate monooxygenase SsuD/methylene tetrahydromethanopterin reductase-like flavin-dependent oxidoreductase (luciferase family)
MKFVLFHLMPYRSLDFNAAKKYRSVWTVLPNSFYDPRKGAEDYEAYIEQLVSGEKLGFDIIAVNEHHQTAYGLMPAPNLIASALIQRTKAVRIGVFGRALPLVNNPINIAEEFAMLDNLSKGRLVVGFVRGIGSEYHTSGVNPAFSHERFHEAHEVPSGTRLEFGMAYPG